MDPWTKATIDASRELAETALGCELSVEATEGNETGFSEMTACFVSLTGQDISVQVGVASDTKGSLALAQALLGEEVELPPSDINDALGELANIVAGSVKQRMIVQYPTIRLGLPLVVDGHLRPTEKQKLVGVSVRFGEIPATLIVLSDAV